MTDRIKEIAALSDQEAYDLWRRLAHELHKSDAGFARYYGLSISTVPKWANSRPPTWAIVALMDQAEATASHEIVDAFEKVIRGVQERKRLLESRSLSEE